MPLTLNGTTGEIFPSWTTATRPASPVAGQTGFNTTTGQMETYSGSAWTLAVNATSQGTSGQYLQSAGAGAAPTWATISTTGQLIRAPQLLISGTSYTPPTGCTSIYVEVVGGGGGSGGCNGTSVSNNSTGGGGAGGYAAKYFTVTGNTPPYNYAIGAAGTAGTSAPTNGGAGGDTTFTVGATTITGSGGSGSSGASGGNATSGGAGGAATNGDLNITGQAGGNSLRSPNLSGAGGSTIFGFGGSPATASAGKSATGYGSGGGGASIAATAAGAAGGAGVIRIWEYT